jgi:hypothetical protein
MASFLCCVAAMPKELLTDHAINMRHLLPNHAPHPIEARSSRPTGTAHAARRIARADDDDNDRPRRLARDPCLPELLQDFGQDVLRISGKEPSQALTGFLLPPLIRQFDQMAKPVSRILLVCGNPFAGLGRGSL